MQRCLDRTDLVVLLLLLPSITPLQDTSPNVLLLLLLLLLAGCF